MFSIMDDEDLKRLGMAAFDLEEKSAGEQDCRGWNKCITAIWKSYNEMKENEEKEC